MELSWSPQIPRDPGTGPYSYSLGGSLTGSPFPWSNVGGWLGPWGPQLMYSWGTNPPLDMPTKLLSILFLSTSREGTPPSRVSPRSRQEASPPRGLGPCVVSAQWLGGRFSHVLCTRITRGL